VNTFVDFHVDVACNTNASDVCEIKFTYLLTRFLCVKNISDKVGRHLLA